MGDKKWASALFDFAGEDVGDLAFQEGDLLEVVDSSDSDWWKGKLKGVGKIGSFPSNYAELIFGTGKMKRARATFDFSAEDPAEISFSAGDMISVFVTPDGGWWEGCAPDGSIGLFPENRVELLK